MDLRQMYIDHLGELVYRNFKMRARVRYPQQYANVPLMEGVDIRDRRIWVWSDTHFEHHNIIEYDNRPFVNVDDMSGQMIRAYNNLVRPTDVCIWGGDVAFTGKEKTTKLVNKCNGYKILVVGNHDFNKKKLCVGGFDEIHLIYEMEFNGHKLVFTHFPFWNLPEPYINIHGHLHGGNHHPREMTEENKHRFIDIGVKCLGYMPHRLKDVLKWV